MNDCCFILLFCTVAAWAASSSEFVWLRDLNNDAHKRHIDLGLSENLKFQLNRGEKLINLHLKENPSIRSDIDMYVVKEMPDGTKRAGKEPVTRNVESKYYHDMVNLAAITVRCVKRVNGPCTRTLEGSLIIGDKYFHIAPVSDLSNVDRLYMNREYQDTPHLIREEMANNKYFDLMNDTIKSNVSDEEFVKRSLSVNLLRSLKNFNGEENNFDHNKRAKTVYGVELHVVVDPPVWEKFYALADEDTENTMNRVKEYVSQVTNGVDIMFKAIQDRDFSIEITLKVITVIKNETDGPYETAKLFEKDGMVSVDAVEYVKAFAVWVLDTPGMPSMSDFDHAMIFTGYNLVGAAGIAYVAAVCSRVSASVVKEEGYWNTMIIASHELGHSFGAEHDSDVGCPVGSIMWWNIPDSVNHETQKAWAFSKCSIDAFENTLAGRSCVKAKATFFDKDEYDNYNKLYPGEIYSVEEQCKIAYGPDSRTCGNRNRDEICAYLSCYNPKIKDYCFSQIAADGTPCGTRNMWCIDGFCVSKPSGETTPKPTTTTVHGKTTPTPQSTTTTLPTPTCKDYDVCEHLSLMYKSIKRFCFDLGEICCETCKVKTKCEDLGYMDWTCADLRSFYSKKSKFCSKWSRNCCMTCSKTVTEPMK